MPLSLNEIRDRARAFAREWDGETSERAEAQSFWNDFFHVFGKKRRSVAVYEQKARRFAGKAEGRIDLFWPGVMLAGPTRLHHNSLLHVSRGTGSKIK